MEAAAARPDLRLVDTTTGEVTDAPDLVALHARIQELEDQLEGAKDGWAAAKGEIKKVRRQLAEALGVEPEAEQIMEVLEFWRPLCMPNASIIVGSERWLKTRERLREKEPGSKRPAHSKLKLKAAVVGARMSDFHVKNDYLDAKTIFRDTGTVEAHVARAVQFKRAYGTSALTLVEELGSPVLAWLSRRCGCGHLWLEHLKSGPGPDGNQPCGSCRCPNFGESLDDQVERWKVEHGGEVPEAALMAAVHP